MNYMSTVPYHASTPVKSEGILDIILGNGEGGPTLTSTLPGFGIQFDASHLGKSCTPVKIDDFLSDNLRGGIFGDGETPVMILRMCIKKPGSEYRVPADFAALKPLIQMAEDDFRKNSSKEVFVYMTIRFGNAASSDHTWHTDGFQSGKKQSLKVPEVNYVWADSEPTMFYDGEVDLADVDFSSVNVHTVINARVEADLASAEPVGKTLVADVCGVYAMNPFVIHRKPASVASGFRRFVRLTFCETEIQDDTCTANPHLPMPRYDNRDARWALKEET